MKNIIGGIITLVIGGTIFTVSQSDVIKNFSKNTGMSQEQATEYVNNIQQDNLDSFSNIGQELINDGNSVLSEVQSIDCVNYVYDWETPLLTCQNGISQLKTIGSHEIVLGNCYKALDTDLGSGADSKIKECISDIDTVNSDYNLPVITKLMDAGTVSGFKHSNIYNKSILETAITSK